MTVFKLCSKFGFWIGWNEPFFEFYPTVRNMCVNVMSFHLPNLRLRVWLGVERIGQYHQRPRGCSWHNPISQNNANRIKKLDCFIITDTYFTLIERSSFTKCLHWKWVNGDLDDVEGVLEHFLPRRIGQPALGNVADSVTHRRSLRVAH